ncbi:hypothetical protein BEL04_13720 [Mucilaginibacter sp. PPCGB 2223]|uniref:ATP-binding protein n=1 Tax=Mucilaginibacter sp. PPCGB 2223 TaxID=1886027 RepID=UPI000826F5EA|nr:ATP-binding protein [Mucilaginibacter sp. PPCGB 2223]OCX52512.1 hypothetical protein BEL04_13720 [Mucilaginibacter sp. PPCGB 2223]
MIENPAGTAAVPPSVPPRLPNEAERIAALHSYHILDTAEEKDFDDLTELASIICQTPIALISLVDKDRQWFKSHKGTTETQTPREYSFCAHTITSAEPIMIVDDAHKDERFADNPLVTGHPHIVFYAGVPLVNSDGFALGTLCVIDTRAHELSRQQISGLIVLAQQVIDKLELRRKVLQLEESNQKLYESENRFRNLVSQAPVAIAIYNGPDMVVDQVNERMLNLIGRTADIVGKPLLASRPEMIGHPYMDILKEVYTTGSEHQGFGIKAPVMRGGMINEAYFNATYKPVKNDAGEVMGIMLAATEVTEQVETARQLAEAKQRLEIALEAGALGSAEIALKTGHMISSDQFKKIYGSSKDAELNYRDVLNATLPEYREQIKLLIAEAIANKAIYSAEYQIGWPDNSIHWVSAHGKTRYNEQGQATHMVVVISDITETKHYEQRKDDFLSIASHELKTPITSLKASLQLLDLIKNKPYSPMHVKLIEQSNRSMKKMSTLIDDLLNVNRMTEGQLHLDKRTFVIADLLKSCCSHVRMAGKHELVFEGDAQLQVNADEHRIDQVVVNFVNNAVKYAPDSRDIILKVEKDGNFARISVQDSGPGIPREKVPFLFDRYYRVDHSGAQYTGLGLGLYICAEIVKRHGGDIGVESEPGKGSTFWFTLPLN